MAASTNDIVKLLKELNWINDVKLNLKTYVYSHREALKNPHKSQGDDIAIIGYSESASEKLDGETILFDPEERLAILAQEVFFEIDGSINELYVSVFKDFGFDVFPCSKHDDDLTWILGAIRTKKGLVLFT